MTKSVRLAALCLLAASPALPGFAADAPVIERAPDTDLAAAQAEAAALRRENNHLKDALADNTKELATLRAKLARLDKPAATTDAELAAEKVRADEATARLNTLAPALEKLTAEKAALESQLASSRELDTKLADAQRRLTSLQTDNDLLRTAAADQVRLTAELDKLRQEKAAAAAQPPAPDFTAKLAETEDKLATALRSYTLLQTENAQLKSAAGDQAALAAELEKARQEKAALETRLAATPPDKSAELSAKLADSENKLSTTLSSFSQLQAENDRLKSAAADQAALTAEVEKLRQENAALEARVAAAPTPAPSEPTPDLSSRLADAESKLTTVLRSYSLLQNENDQLKADAASAAEKAQALSAKNSSESAAQISALFDELRQTQARATALAADNAQLKTRLALVGPPPGSTLASPVRPGTAQADAALQPEAINSKPDAAPAANQPRTHTVVAGDNLAKLARQYYGNANRWDEILRANRDVIKNENVLPVGATLRIP